MNETKNILLKLFILLTFGVGWSSGAWAQSIPVAGKVYTIKAKFSNSNDDSYLSYNGTQLMFERNPVMNDSYWIAELSGASDFVWRFKSVRDESKYLDANSSSGMASASSIYANFNIINCGSVSGLFHLNGRIGNGDTRNNLNIGAWGYTHANTGFGRRGNGAWGTGESSTNWTTDYEITEVIAFNGTANINFVDLSGNNLTDVVVNYRQANGNVVKISTSNSTYDFGEIACPISSFSADGVEKRLVNVDYNRSTKNLTFTLGIKWYKMRVANVNAYVSSDYTDEQGMLLQNTENQPNPSTYAGIWRSVGAGGAAANSNGTNVSLYNAMYNDTKMLAMTKPSNDGQARGAMYASGDVPAGAATVFEQRVKEDQTDSYYFRITGTGVNGNTYINQRNPYFSNWTNGGYGGQGSRFLFEEVPTMGGNVSIVIKGETGTVTYNTQCVTMPGENHITLTDGTTYNFKDMPYLASLFEASDADQHLSSVVFDEKNQRLTFTLVKLYNIVHRPSYFYSKLAAESNKPVYGHIGTLKAGDNGMVTREDDIDEQKTSVFEIPVYLKPGKNPRNLYLPSDKIQWYQRWYNYDTDGLVDRNVMPALYSDNYRIYKNGHVSGAINGGAYKGYMNSPQLFLPTSLPTEEINGKTFYKDYLLTMDISRYKDNRTDGDGNFVEPTLSQRVIYRIMDANKIATEIKAKTDASDWYEKREIIFPCKKRGEQGNNNTGADIVPLNMDLWNYWGYNGSNELVQLTGDGQITVELDPSSTAQLSHYHLIDGTGGISRVNFNQGHFISFTYPEGNVAPDNSKAILNVYFTAGGVRYNLAQFTLTFQPNVEPKVITDVIGKNGDEYISTRSPHAMTEVYGNAIAQLQFDNTRVDMVAPTGGVDHNNEWGGWNSRGEYAFPLDFSMSNYGYGYGSDSGTSRGEYGIFKFSQATGANVPKYTFYPVKKYFDNILNPAAEDREFVENNDYIIYVDAADQAGQVMSIPIDGGLCPGTRLFCYGWMASNAGASNPASVILSIVGHKSDGTTKMLSSYCPGILSAWAYRDQGDTRVYSFNPGDNSVTTGHGDASNWGLWQQIGFSFMLDKEVLDTYTSFSLSVYNNCYNSSGGDYLLDNFQIFANPPKGEVDFTTPLCSDKVRHAKIHSDFNMLKNLSGVNETVPGATIPVTYCFLDAEIFDNFEENGMRINDMFEMDDKGNHNLKSMYSESDPNVINTINHAFRKALVGSRYTKESGKKDYGYHSYNIPLDFESITPYAYNDSKKEIVYREIDNNGVNRVVFKEDIVRGEMDMVPAEEGDRAETHPAYWPYMRPSRTYYLVFAPIITSQASIDNENTATDIFHIHESCSFFGKFTTKDPMHVILDNADIESDLPIRAVCHGETTIFSFDMPAMKANKPIVDEAYCISEESLNGKIVPESQGINHYKYEASFKNNDITGVIKNLPYDWWKGGKYDETHSYRGTIDDYLTATHPTITYSGPKDIAHKQDGALVKIEQAMEDFRFYYPDFGKDKWDADGNSTLTDADWAALEVKNYNQDTGYGLLQSEINTIKDLVNHGIIVLHRNTYDMPLTYEEAEELQAKELSDMMEKEMNDQILELALNLNVDGQLPLKALEGSVLSKLSAEGRQQLTLEELASMTHDQLKGIAAALKTNGKLTDVTDEQINAMSEGELRRTIENALKAMSDSEMQAFASNENNFPNIGHEKRAYLVVRALNILSRETVAKLPEADQQNTTVTRQALREQMISIFREQNVDVLRKMWADVSAKLTEEERAALLKDPVNPETPKNPETMNADDLAVLVEDGLAQLTNNVINDLRSDRYVHFTLVPIMPTQKNFVDEPYIFCPEPRGVKIRITSKEPVMLDGFADMPYPANLTNVPVRLGLKQIKETKTSASKTLRIPVRGLKYAIENGVKAVKLAENTGYYNNLFLTKTNDPAYKQPSASADTDGLTEAINTDGIYLRMVGTVEQMTAIYPKKGQTEPDNFLVVKFKDEMKFREGYTYRIGVNFMEHDKDDNPTISCYGTMLLDLKVVPEYQKWTASVNSDWTNDKNWARADRSELNADNEKVGNVIEGSTDITVADNYPTNEGNEIASSFVPMYFTNVLMDNAAAKTAHLYSKRETPEGKDLKPASRSEKKFLEGLHSTATENIVYDMEVNPSTGAWHDNDNYECVLFGTYIANGITFKPGAQLMNAHLLDYKKAWVEYELQKDKWHLVSSPLQQTYSGEWYSPKDNARQQTPHFYSITYSESLNNRFYPAYYQRGWDKGKADVYRMSKDGMWNANNNPYNVAVALNWSNVYNDVKEDYSTGGFSVKPVFNNGSGDPVLVRMPKDDVNYKYFNFDGSVSGHSTDIARGAESHHRLFSDLLASNETFEQTLTNNSADNLYFLVGNPLMTPMDMTEFFNTNTQFEKKFWVMTDNSQGVSVLNGDAWSSVNAETTVAPLQAFFVKLNEEVTPNGSTTVTYNRNMQYVEGNTPSQASLRRCVGISATDADGNTFSSANIVLSENSQNGYDKSEDAETVIDSNLDGTPTVYTIASSQAMTLNTVPDLDELIPLGMDGNCDDEVIITITNEGIDQDIYLYDAEEGTYSTVGESMSISVSESTCGRYFITTNINRISNNSSATEDVNEDMYDLSGRRIQSAKGNTVIIVGGKKRMVR